MKTLFKIVALILPLLVFSQGDSLPPELKEIRTEVIVKKKEIDSVKSLKVKEIKKQLKIIELIKQEFVKFRFQKASPAKEKPTLGTYDSAAAIKQENEPVYWEEVRRKWTGRLFNKGDTKIRLFKFDENGNVVYLN